MSEHRNIKLTTETERLLYKAYTEEKSERQNLQSIIKDMQNKIKELEQQIEANKEHQEKTSPNTNTKSSPEHVEYCTDEDELAKETEWIRQKTRKKRKLNRSPSISPPQKDTNIVENNNSKEKVKKMPPPPPIILDGVKNYQSFYDFLAESQLNDSVVIKMMTGETLKINAKDDESYRAITKLLTQKNCPWHSYENKQERPIRVMAKKLHHTCMPSKIIEDLKNKGYLIEDATNKLKWNNKEPLNMFILTFKNTEDINKIYKINSILGCKVEIHALKAPKLIPQCKRCQAYGHTQKYCSKEPRCVNTFTAISGRIDLMHIQHSVRHAKSPPTRWCGMDIFGLSSGRKEINTVLQLSHQIL